MGATVRLRVVLVDEHEIILHGLREFLRTVDDLEVVGEARSAAAGLTVVAETKPDVALLDVRLPDRDGITLCREIRESHPSVRCLMFSSFGHEDAMLEALMAGASGYLLKEARLPVVADSIRSVGDGKTLLDPALTSKVLERLRTGISPDNDSLTATEERLLTLIIRGLSNKEISIEMRLAEQTVKNYVSGLLTKLGLKRRTQAALYVANRAQGRLEFPSSD